MGEAQANVNDSLWETGQVTLFSNELLTKVFILFFLTSPARQTSILIKKVLLKIKVFSKS
jgi:hypothetical protein